MAGELMGDECGNEVRATRPSANTLILVLGIVLVLLSWTPVGQVATKTMWTSEDSAALNRIRQEYHRSTYQPPERQGVSQEVATAKHERLKSEFETMRKKLSRARQQPKVWSRWLLWSGAALVTIGAAGFYWQRPDQ